MKYSSNDQQRLDAVLEHVNNFLEKGKSKVNPSILTADGINTITGEHAQWTYATGEKKTISNFASQQNFLRTLVLLSNLTSDKKYIDYAEKLTRFIFDNYVSEEGLLRWASNCYINLDTLEIESSILKAPQHALKNHSPFYEFLYQVDPKKTHDYIVQMWKTHILNWDTFDMERQGNFGQTLGKDISQDAVHNFNIVDDKDYIEYEVDGVKRRTLNLPFIDKGISFINFGADLYYAACFLGAKEGNTNATDWGKYLLNQYELAKNPDTGLPVYQFSRPGRQESCTIEMYNDETFTGTACGDRAIRQFDHDFGPIAQEANFLDKWKASAILVGTIPMNFYIAEMTGDNEIITQGIETILNYLKYSLVYKEGKPYFIPLWNDGQSLAEYEFTKGGYFGKKGFVLETIPADERYIYSLSIALTHLERNSNEFAEILNHIKSLFEGLGYGDFNNINIENITKDSSYMILSLINLYHVFKDELYLELARKIGDNIIAKRFRRGFILKTENHLYARIAEIDSLVLLTLDATLKGNYDIVPRFINETGFVHGSIMKETGEVVTQYDYNVIYNKTL